MDDLIKQREQNKIVEKRETALWLSFIKEQRERFDFADVSQHLAYEKNLEDTMIINNALTNWLSNPKLSAEKKKELNDLILSLWRVMAYCGNIETTIKYAVSKYVTTEKRNDELIADLAQLKLKYRNLEVSTNNTIESLGKEIEFLSK